jgi:sulfofructosephosphate aldolase
VKPLGGPTLDALARASGTFVMVAMDQRESLRTMLREHGHDATGERVARFKRAVAAELAPRASGFLIDRDHVDAVAPLVPHGLILAVDRLVQEPGGVVEDTSLDEDVDPPRGVVGLKLLVIWRDDDRRAERVEMSRRFVQLAERHGLLSVLEPVVRVPEEQREDAIVEAARELGAVRPSLYKCQVPLYGRGDPAEVTRHARRIDEVLPVPWVVLSQGVEPHDFPRAVEAACKGGASGMLAGRALWTATLRADDPTELLRARSVPRLQELAEIVDAHGRPWRENGAR